MKTKHPTPNDQRSRAKNPKDKECDKDLQNRMELGHITPQEATEIKERKKTN